MDPLVSTDWLAAELGAPDLRVLECTVFLRPADGGGMRVESGRTAWAEGHVPTSAFADLGRELSDPSSPFGFTAPGADALAAAFGRLGVGDGTRVVLCDRNGTMWATRAWWLLRSIGFDSAAVLDGGVRAWVAEGRPLVTGPAPDHPAAVLTARPRPEVFASLDEVRALTEGTASACLVNALSPDQHAGRDLTYGRAGHLPGAVNVYALDLVDPDTHRYRPVDELRRRFAEAGVDPDPAAGRIVTYCGGGIAATSDAFALTLLGHDDVAVFDGSMSQWVAEGLPLET